MISVVLNVYDTCGSPFSFFLVANFSFFCSIFLYTDVTNLYEKEEGKNKLSFKCDKLHVQEVNLFEFSVQFLETGHKLRCYKVIDWWDSTSTPKPALN